MRLLTVVNPDGSFRDDFLRMLANETVTFRGEQFVFDRMFEIDRFVDWKRHTFITGEHNFPLTLLVAHVYVHARDGYRGYERHINLDAWRPGV